MSIVELVSPLDSLAESSENVAFFYCSIGQQERIFPPFFFKKCKSAKYLQIFSQMLETN